jgi:hypothetical protein
VSILTKREVWRRERKRTKRAPLGLTRDEQDNVRVVLRVLRYRHGSWVALARLLGMQLKTLKGAASKRGSRPPTPGLALHASRLAGVPMEDVLSGAFPKQGDCPLCGRR